MAPILHENVLERDIFGIVHDGVIYPFSFYDVRWIPGSVAEGKENLYAFVRGEGERLLVEASGLPQIGASSSSLTDPGIQEHFYDKKLKGKHFYSDGEQLVFISMTAVDHDLMNEVAEKIIEQVKFLGSRNSRVLSIGEGQGHLAQALKNKGLYIQAVDISEKNIEAARERGIIIKKADAENLSFPRNTFDMVIFNESIGSMNPQLVLAEAKRVLRPGGRIILTTYNLEKESVEQDESFTHYKGYTVRQLSDMLGDFADVGHQELESPAGLGILNFFMAVKADNLKGKKLAGTSSAITVEDLVESINQKTDRQITAQGNGQRYEVLVRKASNRTLEILLKDLANNKIGVAGKGVLNHDKIEDFEMFLDRVTFQGAVYDLSLKGLGRGIQRIFSQGLPSAVRYLEGRIIEENTIAFLKESCRLDSKGNIYFRTDNSSEELIDNEQALQHVLSRTLAGQVWLGLRDGQPINTKPYFDSLSLYAEEHQRGDQPVEKIHGVQGLRKFLEKQGNDIDVIFVAQRTSSSVLSVQEAEEFEQALLVRNGLFIRRSTIQVNGQQVDVVYDFNATYLRVGGVVILTKDKSDRLKEFLDDKDRAFLEQKAVIIDSRMDYLSYIIPMIAFMMETDFQGKAVWDYGAGNGVLGLVALRLGAEKIIAIENNSASFVSARSGFERMLGRQAVVYLKGSSWEKHKIKDGQRVFLIEADMNTIFPRRKGWRQTIDKKFDIGPDSIVLADVGAFYPQVHDNLIKDVLENKSPILILGGYDQKPSSDLERYFEDFFDGGWDSYSAPYTAQRFDEQNISWEMKEHAGKGSRNEDKRFQALKVLKEGQQRTSSALIHQESLGNGTSVVFSADDQKIRELIAAGQPFLIDENGQPATRSVESEGFKRFTTPFASIKERLGEDVFEDFYQRALALQRTDPGKELIVVSWGCGQGVELRQMEEELKNRGIHNVRLFGFANIYFPSWAQGDSQITWILDDASRFAEYFKDGEIDLMFSFIGLFHVRPFDRHRQYMESIASKIGPKGTVVYDYGIALTNNDFNELSGSYDVHPSWRKGIIRLQPRSSLSEDANDDAVAIFPSEGVDAAGARISYQHDFFVFKEKALYPQDNLQYLGPEDSVRVVERDGRMQIEIFKGRLGQEGLVARYAAPQASSSIFSSPFEIAGVGLC
ncbi:MAG TPA: methyltransferase domain-containing protein, partial [Candidatus Omnitrophota bacterium]|nr:methyltransferase domain-containing protein [Candidatus Omnitrophota bacterium]